MSNRFVKQEKESIIRGILREELDRSERIEALYLKELESLLKGSLQVKIIRGREYLYRCFRDGKKVKSVFVPRDEAKKIGESIQRRREIESSLKRFRADRELARKVLR